MAKDIKTPDATEPSQPAEPAAQGRNTPAKAPKSLHPALDRLEDLIEAIAPYPVQGG